jgi:hypothetical protein
MKKYKIAHTFTIPESGDDDPIYHIPDIDSGITLCGWVDVPYEEHDAHEHPVTCVRCIGIVAYCKKL